MARYTGPKNKLSRREGVDLFNKGVKLRRLNVPPGVHGPKMRSRRASDYGNQLREKQKVRRMYGILESQFRKYMEIAAKDRHATGESLMQGLESRIDNVIYRSGLVPTRMMARQLVVHGHVKINDQKVDRPSYQVKTGDMIVLSDSIMKTPVIMKSLEDEESMIPSWLVKKGGVIKIERMPNLEDVQEEINLQFIVEYYSR